MAQERGVTYDYDHVEKVENAQKGLQNHIENINNRLRSTKLPEIERKALQQELSEASKWLDYTEEFVPREKK